jgi:hypothetical protein
MQCGAMQPTKARTTLATCSARLLGCGSIARSARTTRRSRALLPKAAYAGRLIGAALSLNTRKEQGTTMRLWLIIFVTGLASSGLQAAQAQVTIDITKLTCYNFLADQLTDSRTLGIWLNGYVNGARGKTMIEPLSAGHLDLLAYCQSHMDTLVLDAARNVFSADK